MKEKLINENTSEMDKDQKRVFEVLVCPIVSTKNINNIAMYQNGQQKVILSSQTYGKTADEDMCDLSIRFYEILYGLQEGSMLEQAKKCSNIYNWTYAGDTMNSFETITKFSGEQKKKEWNESYHCLANFWAINGKIGRGTCKISKNSGGKYVNPITLESFNKGKRDYVDRFLSENYKDGSDGLVEFAKYHFIDNGVYIDKENKVIEFSKIKSPCDNFQSAVDEIIDKMMLNICKRAALIVKNEEKCTELFKYFKSINLL